MELKKVKAHTGVWGNEEADSLAKSDANSMINNIDLQIDNNLEIIEVLENKKQLQIDNIILKLNNIQIRLDLL